MKILSSIMKVLGVLLIALSLLAFGSDFLPVGGISFGGHETSSGKYEFYKIVPSEGVNFVYVGLMLALLGVVFFLVSSLLKRKYKAT